MNNNQIYTGLIASAIISGCATHKTEYSSRQIIPGEVVWKSEVKQNKNYKSDNKYALEISVNIEDNHAKIYRRDKNLHSKTNSNDIVQIVCREVYDCTYKKDKLVDKSLSKLLIYHICKTGTCKKDSLYVPRRFIQR